MTSEAKSPAQLEEFLARVARIRDVIAPGSRGGEIDSKETALAARERAFVEASEKHRTEAARLDIERRWIAEAKAELQALRERLAEDQAFRERMNREIARIREAVAQGAPLAEAAAPLMAKLDRAQ